MRNHLNVSGVAAADLAGEALLEQVLAPGRGESHTPEIEQLRKDIGRRRSKPCHLIVRVLLADLEEGRTIEQVLAFPRLLSAILVAHAQALGTVGSIPRRTISDLHAIETALEGALNAAQVRCAYDGSRSARIELRDRAQELIPVLHELVTVVNREILTPAASAA